MAFKVPEDLRMRGGRLGTDSSAGNNGVFMLPLREKGEILRIIAGEGMGWEHVSVSLSHRTPTWEEMCKVKDLFWSDDDCVVQFHPAKADYVNVHEHCLHLWRPIGGGFPAPSAIMV